MGGVEGLEALPGEAGDGEGQAAAAVPVGVARAQVVQEQLPEHGLRVGVGALHLVVHHAFDDQGGGQVLQVIGLQSGSKKYKLKIQFCLILTNI